MSDLSTSVLPALKRRWPLLLLALAVLLLPLYVGGFFLQVGLFVMAAAVAAIGLTVVVGTAGQLSLAHAFFVGLGAYGYAILAGDPDRVHAPGFGLPPLVAVVGAVLGAGVAGWLFSFVARRVHGIYLGIASLALPLLGAHLVKNLGQWTGGFEGLSVAPLAIGPLAFDDFSEPWMVLGVAFGMVERLWYLFAVVVVAVVVIARRLLGSRMGRAMAMVRDSETGAQVMGIDVAKVKAQAFVLSSVLGGLGGVMFALAATRIVPEAFTIQMSIQYVAMVIIGGLGSVGGAVLGAVVIQSLVLLLPYYSNFLPFLAEPGQEGFTAGWLAVVVYGTGVVVCTLLLPGGLVRLLEGRPRRDHTTDATPRGADTAAAEIEPIDAAPLAPADLAGPYQK